MDMVMFEMTSRWMSYSAALDTSSSTSVCVWLADSSCKYMRYIYVDVWMTDSEQCSIAMLLILKQVLKDMSLTSSRLVFIVFFLFFRAPVCFLKMGRRRRCTSAVAGVFQI